LQVWDLGSQVCMRKSIPDRLSLLKAQPNQVKVVASEVLLDWPCKYN
jgi:hypothetical protein